MHAKQNTFKLQGLRASREAWHVLMRQDDVVDANINFDFEPDQSKEVSMPRQIGTDRIKPVRAHASCMI